LILLNQFFYFLWHCFLLCLNLLFIFIVDLLPRNLNPIYLKPC